MNTLTKAITIMVAVLLLYYKIPKAAATYKVMEGKASNLTKHNVSFY